MIFKVCGALNGVGITPEIARYTITHAKICSVIVSFLRPVVAVPSVLFAFLRARLFAAASGDAAAFGPQGLAEAFARGFGVDSASGCDPRYAVDGPV